MVAVNHESFYICAANKATIAKCYLGTTSVHLGGVNGSSWRSDDFSIKCDFVRWQLNPAISTFHNAAEAAGRSWWSSAQLSTAFRRGALSRFLEGLWIIRNSKSSAAVVSFTNNCRILPVLSASVNIKQKLIDAEKAPPWMRARIFIWTGRIATTYIMLARLFMSTYKQNEAQLWIIITDQRAQIPG